MLRVFEAFSGVGAQRMALRNLGVEHEVVGISEIDKFAIKSYEAIHGETVNFGDISKLNPKDLYLELPFLKTASSPPSYSTEKIAIPSLPFL